MATKSFPLAVVIRAVDKASGTIRRVQNSISAFDQGITRRLASFKKWTGIEDAVGPAKKLGGALGDIRDRMMGLIGIGSTFAAVGVAAVYKLTMSYVDAASEINDVSTALGVGAERLQEWRYAGQQNGVAIEEMDKNLGIFTRNLGKAMRGKGPADLLRSMGLRKGDLKSADTALPKVADGLMRIRNPALRAAAAAELFGKSGLKMLTLFAGDDKIGQGSKALAFYAAELRRVNGVISNDSVAAADAFGDRLDKLKTAFGGVRNVAGEALLPVLTEQIDKMTAYLEQHGPEIRKWFEQFAKDLPGYIDKTRKAFSDLMETLQPVINIVQVLVNTFGGPKVLLATIAGIITATFVPALISATVAMWQLNVALWSNPIGLVILAVLALVGAILYFAIKIEDGKLKLTKFGEVLVWLQNAPLRLIKFAIQQVLDSIEKWGILVQSVRAVFVDFFDYIGGKFSEAAGWINAFGDNLSSMIPDWAKGMLGGSVVNIGNGGALAGASIAQSMAAPKQSSEVRVKVDLNNLPPGSRVSTQQNGSPQFELNQGYQFGSAH